MQFPSTILKVKKMERMKRKHKMTGVRKKASDSRKTKKIRHQTAPRQARRRAREKEREERRENGREEKTRHKQN